MRNRGRKGEYEVMVMEYRWGYKGCNQLNRLLFLYRIVNMKSQINRQQRKSAVKDYLRKITLPNSQTAQQNHQSIANAQSKSIIINSHRGVQSHRGSRPKVQILKTPMPSHQSTANHSRKNSVNLHGMMTARGSANDERQSKKKQSEKRSKQHNRSISTISKKCGVDIKKMLKMDLSKLKLKDEDKVVSRHMQYDIYKQVSKESFECQYVIGKGGFGKVWSVKFKKNNKFYAMKEMHKTKIIGKKSINSVMNEKELLSQLRHPFIANMSYAFQDREKLYLIMDLLVGGDLRYHMGCRRRFRQWEAKFFIGCILMGLEFLHLNNIIHRDIKPENIVFDERGYLRITDMGIARAVKPNNNSDTSGTPGYMAPEVMCRQDHSFPVDFYAVGAIAYELMLGKRPYYGKDRKEIRDQILSRQVQVRSDEIPQGWSLQAADFINKMIQRKPSQRLGSANGVNEIKEHAWFTDFPWPQLTKKTISSPFVPINVIESKDYKDQISQSSMDQNEQQSKLLLRDENLELLFKGYYYSNKKEEIKESSKNVKKENNAKTTSNTHYSFVQEKEISKAKPKVNNYFKK